MWFLFAVEAQIPTAITVRCFPWTSKEPSCPCTSHSFSPHAHTYKQHSPKWLTHNPDSLGGHQVRLCWKYLEVTTHATGPLLPPPTHTHMHTQQCAVRLEDSVGDNSPPLGWRSKERSYKEQEYLCIVSDSYGLHSLLLLSQYMEINMNPFLTEMFASLSSKASLPLERISVNVLTWKDMFCFLYSVQFNCLVTLIFNMKQKKKKKEWLEMGLGRKCTVFYLSVPVIF